MKFASVFNTITCLLVLVSVSCEKEVLPAYELHMFDISSESEWEYWWVCATGESMFSQDAELYYSPGPDQMGYHIMLDQQGYPEYIVIGDVITHISGGKNKLDVAVIDAEGSIQVFRDLDNKWQESGSPGDESMQSLIKLYGQAVDLAGQLMSSGIIPYDRQRYSEPLGSGTVLARSEQLTLHPELTLNEIATADPEMLGDAIQCSGQPYPDCIVESGSMIFYTAKNILLDKEDEIAKTTALLTEDPAQTELAIIVDAAYDKLKELTIHLWLMDGFFCHEYEPAPVEWSNIANYTITADNENAFTLWILCYDIIFISNNVINTILESQFTGDSYAKLTAEAYALRGYAYFILSVKFWGVSIELETDYFRGNRQSTQVESINQALNDLIAARSMLNYTDIDDGNTIKMDAGAVEALLAKVNLYLGRYQEATTYVQQLFDSGYYEYDGNNPYTSLTSPGTIQAFELNNSKLLSKYYKKGNIIPISHYTEQLLIKLECSFRNYTNEWQPIYEMLTGESKDEITEQEVFDLWMALMSNEGITLNTMIRFDNWWNYLQLGMEFMLYLPFHPSMFELNPHLMQMPGY